jgi:ubiquinone/menaquinone biosynthesis C-methylase UbiE
VEKQHVYYNRVASYFDADAMLFKQRYDENPILGKLRNDFRRYTEKHDFSSALEIGCGPGIDMVYFCSKYPDSSFYAFDISEKMVSMAQHNLKKANLTNGFVEQGSVEDIKAMFPGKTFDLVYVYFGGLNTVMDLKVAIRGLRSVMADNATFIMTNVNRYYVLDVFFKLMKLKFSEAFSRFQNRWQGYSPGRDLPSKVYSYKKVKKDIAPEFKIIEKRGYSIFYPPWYAAAHLRRFPSLERPLWKLDRCLQKTPLWNYGEYSIYVMKASSVNHD